MGLAWGLLERAPLLLLLVSTVSGFCHHSPAVHRFDQSDCALKLAQTTGLRPPRGILCTVRTSVGARLHMADKDAKKDEPFEV
jgi:hypothetical protein